MGSEMAAAKILVVDDDKNLLELARTRLEAANYTVSTAPGVEEASAAAAKDGFDLAIVDLRLADEDGITLMEKLHALNPEMPVIILTGHASVEGAVEAMKRGAYTYLTKPFDPRELVLQIGRALESRKLANENQRLRGLLKEKYDFANIVAKSDIMQKLLEGVSRIAKSDSTVYIHGESGTGKELIAKALHLASDRECNLRRGLHSNPVTIDDVVRRHEPVQQRVLLLTTRGVHPSIPCPGQRDVRDIRARGETRAHRRPRGDRSQAWSLHTIRLEPFTRARPLRDRRESN